MTEARGERMARDVQEWLAWEDARLLDCALGMQFLSAHDLADEFGRDPLLILRRILDSEIPDMVGFEVARGSEEESEFLALGLAGAPLEMVLRWCTATEVAVDRPEWDELAMYMTADLRPATELAREAGLWLTRFDQVEALQQLVDVPTNALARAVAAVLGRLDAPTPCEVLAQILGSRAPEAPIDWHHIDRVPLDVQHSRTFRWRASKKRRTTRRRHPRAVGRRA
ncbi:hypothetical protein [Ramlibacter sp. AN1133]|uniref:hypothetical protein n=1 Tax=Ramlibacter sp. AN1133 TaxID=3133429 RepID=UPI0030BBC318